MLDWLKQKFSGMQSGWQRVHQVPGTVFPFPKGAKLRPEEEVILALPSAVVVGDERIGSIILCDDDAELTLHDKVEAWYVRLKLGMTFSLARSCDVMLIAADSRPRFFNYLRPEAENIERSK